VWQDDPFSVYAKVERVYIEGKLVFDRSKTPVQGSDFELGLVAPHRATKAPPREASPKAPKAKAAPAPKASRPEPEASLTAEDPS
jgi:hypothetical protein